jgi:hypothetical protein
MGRLPEPIDRLVLLIVPGWVTRLTWKFPLVEKPGNAGPPMTTLMSSILKATGELN